MRVALLNVVVIRKQVHESPNLREISSILMGKTFRTACMAEVHKLGQKVIMFGIGGDASC